MKLKSCNSPAYKAIACHASKHWSRPDIIEHLAIDVRSCLFKFIRLTKRTTHYKILCVLSLINNGIQYEVQRVVDQAFVWMYNCVNHINPTNFVFVLSSKQRCPFREPLKCAYRISMMESSLNNLEICLAEYKKHLLSMESLITCYAAFEAYLLNNVSEICLIYNDTFTNVPSIQPTIHDYFESDRLCACLSDYTIISEDYDLVALFGATRIITNVVHGYIQCVTLQDLMVTFRCNTRTELLNKCIIAGTDYNLGVKGFGVAKIIRMEPQLASELCETCLTFQGIDITHILPFYML
jgi:hypothetical protein